MVHHTAASPAPTRPAGGRRHAVPATTVRGRPVRNAARSSGGARSRQARRRRSGRDWQAIVDAEIPEWATSAHPQSMHAMGGSRCRARRRAQPSRSRRGARPRGAGVFCIVLEGCPTRSPAWSPTRSTCVRSASGPVATATARARVTTNLLGLQDRLIPKFRAPATPTSRPTRSTPSVAFPAACARRTVPGRQRELPPDDDVLKRWALRECYETA